MHYFFQPYNIFKCRPGRSVSNFRIQTNHYYEQTRRVAEQCEGVQTSGETISVLIVFGQLVVLPQLL